jgi:hypothetical protein
MDAEDWRLENPEAAASVRFTLGCAGHDSSAAARHAAAAREEREKRDSEDCNEGYLFHGCCKVAQLAG